MLSPTGLLKVHAHNLLRNLYNKITYLSATQVSVRRENGDTEVLLQHPPQRWTLDRRVLT